jgi:hypothetical protein
VTRFVQRSRTDYIAIAKRLLSVCSSAISRRFPSDSAGIPQRLHSDSALRSVREPTTDRLQSDSAEIIHLSRSDFKASRSDLASIVQHIAPILQRFQTYRKAISQQSRSNSVVIPQRSRSESAANPQRICSDSAAIAQRSKSLS